SLQPVAVDMIEDAAVARARVLVDQHERGAGDAQRRAPAATNAARQRRLARPQLARQADDVARLQQFAQANAEALRLRQAGADEIERPVVENGHSPTCGADLLSRPEDKSTDFPYRYN